MLFQSALFIEAETSSGLERLVVRPLVCLRFGVGVLSIVEGHVSCLILILLLMLLCMNGVSFAKFYCQI